MLHFFVICPQGIQIKATARYHYTSTSVAKIWNTENITCQGGCGVRGTLIHSWWACKWQSLRKTVWQFLQDKHTVTIRSSNCDPWYVPRGVKSVCPHKNLHVGVYTSFIHNCQSPKAIRMSFSR